MDQLRAKLVV